MLIFILFTRKGSVIERSFEERFRVLSCIQTCLECNELSILCLCLCLHICIIITHINIHIYSSSNIHNSYISPYAYSSHYNPFKGRSPPPLLLLEYDKVFISMIISTSLFFRLIAYLYIYLSNCLCILSCIV